MCLAIPGKLVRWIDNEPLLALAEVEFGPIKRQCHMACVPEARVGDYVLVHAGVAIAQIDCVEAERALADLASLPGEGEPSADRLEESAGR